MNILIPEMSLVVFNKIIKKSYVYSHDLLDASIINKGWLYKEKILDFVLENQACWSNDN